MRGVLVKTGNPPRHRTQPPARRSDVVSFRDLDLSNAMRILRHAHRPDPMESQGTPRTRLQTIIDALCDLSVHDALTGLVNAAFFHAFLDREINRSSRTGRPCGLI